MCAGDVGVSADVCADVSADVSAGVFAGDVGVSASFVALCVLFAYVRYMHTSGGGSCTNKLGEFY